MSYSSDSEAFESADEDFDGDAPIKETKSSAVSDGKSKTDKVNLEEKLKEVVSLRESSDKKIADSPIEVKDNQIKVIPEKKPEIIPVVEAKVDLVDLSEEKSDIDAKPEKEVNLEKIEVKVEESVKLEKDIIPDVIKVEEKQPLKLNPPTVPIDDVAKKKNSDDGGDADGWEFDDWDEEASVDPAKEKQDEEEEEVGWELEDWGDEPIVPTKPNAKSGEEYFPILADISPKKGVKSDPGLLGNISKYLISSESPNQSNDEKNTESEVHPASGASNWGWKPWGGVVSLLSTASEGVASITSQVSSVIESGIGVPDPAEMAKIQRENQKKQEVGKIELQEQFDSTSETKADGQSKKSDDRSLLLGSIVSGVTQIGNRVIAGGLDTLEGIGKKTMNILQENDPGLLKKRKMLMMDNDAPVLSQILREAKEKTEEAERNLQLMHKQQYKKQLHFETLFDDYHGLVHLEALEMLSRQSTMKLQTLVAPLSGRALDELQETLDEVKELCELPEQDTEDVDGSHTVEELSEKLAACIEDLDIPIDFSDLLQCWRRSIEWLKSETQTDPQDIHNKALRCLAQTTALAVQRLHKLAELLLIKDRHSTADEADSLVQLTTTVCWHLSGIAAKFGGTLSQLENCDDANSLITSTFLEGSNSISYIQNAFHLFIPILQVGAA